MQAGPLQASLGHGPPGPPRLRGRAAARALGAAGPGRGAVPRGRGEAVPAAAPRRRGLGAGRAAAPAACEPGVEAAVSGPPRARAPRCLRARGLPARRPRRRGRGGSVCTAASPVLRPGGLRPSLRRRRRRGRLLRAPGRPVGPGGNRHRHLRAVAGLSGPGLGPLLGCRATTALPRGRADAQGGVFQLLGAPVAALLWPPALQPAQPTEGRPHAHTFREGPRRAAGALGVAGT
mmetsp:Transcript_24818/g.69698  ORF Transcript_24818/g.69698 Transcript_24818/m.69698 type:complete len:234 (+) Transcript_24818:143-844(+)